MSRASVQTLKKSGYCLTEVPRSCLSKIQWTEPVETERSTPLDVDRIIPDFDMCHFIDSQAKSALASLYVAAQRWTQAPLISKTLICPSIFDKGEIGKKSRSAEVDFPALSTRKVIMRARYAGPGQPLAMLNPGI